MKTVGVIGGLGPETTSEFYLDLIFSCQKKDRSHRTSIIITSVPLPYEIEDDAIVKNTGFEKILPFLVAEAKRLERAGADFIVMPCNSLHVFIKEIRSAVNIPVLSIVEETTKFLKEEGITKVGIISTSITLDKKLYESPFITNGIEQVRPNDFQQAQIDKIIHNLVSNRQGNKDREELMNIIDDFETRSVNHIILACTDLQLLKPQHPRLKILDTMKIFAGVTVRKILNHS